MGKGSKRNVRRKFDQKPNLLKVAGGILEGSLIKHKNG